MGDSYHHTLKYTHFESWSKKWEGFLGTGVAKAGARTAQLKLITTYKGPTKTLRR